MEIVISLTLLKVIGTIFVMTNVGFTFAVASVAFFGRDTDLMDIALGIPVVVSMLATSGMAFYLLWG